MSLKNKWREYHNANPEVYDLFVKFTFNVIRRGYTNYSANAIFERIRWHTDIETKDNSGFKISNNHRAYYARHFMNCNPEYEGFFRTKPVKEDREEVHNNEPT